MNWWSVPSWPAVTMQPATRSRRGARWPVPRRQPRSCRDGSPARRLTLRPPLRRSGQTKWAMADVPGTRSLVSSLITRLHQRLKGAIGDARRRGRVSWRQSRARDGQRRTHCPSLGACRAPGPSWMWAAALTLAVVPGRRSRCHLRRATSTLAILAASIALRIRQRRYTAHLPKLGPRPWPRPRDRSALSATRT